MYPGTGRTGTETTGNRVLIGTGWNSFVDLGFADVDGDGRTDVVGRDGGGNMWAYPHSGGTGTQALGGRVLLGTGWWPADWPAFRLADFGNDGKTDIVGHNANGKLLLYPNTSSGGSMTFGAPSVFGEGWWPGEWNFLATDMNNDGTPEQAGITRTGDLYHFTPGRNLIGIGMNGYDVIF